LQLCWRKGNNHFIEDFFKLGFKLKLTHKFRITDRQMLNIEISNRQNKIIGMVPLICWKKIRVGRSAKFFFLWLS
jgi:hypothetical protein